MGGFSAEWLEVAIEMLGIQDIEALICDLGTIRDWQNRSK